VVALDIANVVAVVAADTVVVAAAGAAKPRKPLKSRGGSGRPFSFGDAAVLHVDAARSGSGVV
jgi:hypothetical protein